MKNFIELKTRRDAALSVNVNNIACIIKTSDTECLIQLNGNHSVAAIEDYEDVMEKISKAIGE